MGQGPKRTCIGCRGIFSKADVVRIVAGPEGPVIDYREKLPGRAAYVCPRADCIERAMARDVLSRALRTRLSAPPADRFLGELAGVMQERIRSLVSMATKAGATVSGFSAVDDALRKGRIEVLLFAVDLSDGTREKLVPPEARQPERQATLFTKSEMGSMTGRAEAGIIGIIEKGFSNAVWTELQRLKGLRNAHP